MLQPPVSLADIAEYLGARLVGDPRTLITGIATLQQAHEGQISFLANAVYRKFLPATRASAVILDPGSAADFTGNALILDNPYAGYARLTAVFGHLSAGSSRDIHPSAVIADNVALPECIQVGANVVIESGARLGEQVSLGAGTVIGRNVVIGAGSSLCANVTVYYDVMIGERAVIHSGAVIGGDGFGFAPDAGQWVKIHHLASVVIGNDVEVGANTCIDRGALSDTVIENGVKLDNLVQIAHGVKVGEQTVMAGCSAAAGSAEIGPHCLIGGGAGIVGHIKVAEKVTITAMSLVTKSIDKPGVYSSGTPIQPAGRWRKNAVLSGQLDEINRRLKQLEKAGNQNNGKKNGKKKRD